MNTARHFINFGVTLAMAILGSPLAAEEITDPTKPEPPASPAKAADAPPSPVTLTATYTADLLSNISGNKPGVAYIDLLKVSLAYDGATAGHPGLSGLVSLEHTFGSQFTDERIGAEQDASGNEAQPGALRLYEAWLQQETMDGRGGVKAGFIDINSTFDVQETAALFLNGSHGLGPEFGDTGENGPSDYPATAIAATAFYRPTETWTAQIGVFDGVAGDPRHRSAFVAVKLHGTLLIGQVEKRFADTARVEIGGWTYTAAFASLDQFDAAGLPLALHGNGGVYGLIEGRLWTPRGETERGLSGWLRLGVANGHINEVETYLGVGLVFTGPIKGRDKDELGFALARAGFGSGARYQAALEGRNASRAETDLEATYRIAVNDWLSIQPDFQYVLRPHGDIQTPNAVVAGLRLVFTYSK